MNGNGNKGKTRTLDMRKDQLKCRRSRQKSQQNLGPFPFPRLPFSKQIQADIYNYSYNLYSKLVLGEVF